MQILDMICLCSVKLDELKQSSDPFILVVIIK